MAIRVETASNNERVHGVVVDAQLAWQCVEAAKMLRESGRPLIIGGYENMTGISTPIPMDKVRLYSYIPDDNARLELGKVLHAGGMMTNEVLASGWPIEHAVPLIRYAMKVKVEEITGESVKDPKLAAN